MLSSLRRVLDIRNRLRSLFYVPISYSAVTVSCVLVDLSTITVCRLQGLRAGSPKSRIVPIFNHLLLSVIPPQLIHIQQSPLEHVQRNVTSISNDISFTPRCRRSAGSARPSLCTCLGNSLSPALSSRRLPRDQDEREATWGRDRDLDWQRGCTAESAIAEINARNQVYQ